VNYERMKKLFLKLLETESPYGFERPAARVISEFLERHGIPWEEDGTAAITGSNTGNIIAAGDGTARIAFYAHMDTLRIPEKKPPLCEGTIVKADGGGLLGIDDMSGVAAVLELAASLGENGGIPQGVRFIFTACEEAGFKGAWALDSRHFTGAYNFVVDSGGIPLVRIVNRGVGQITFTVTVRGVMGHASSRSGKNAAALSARIIPLLKPGKAKQDSFININSVECPGNPNTVPDHCVITGQIHFFDAAEGEALALEMKAAVAGFAARSAPFRAEEEACIAEEEACTADIAFVHDCAPWSVPRDDPIIAYAGEAAAKASLPFELGESGSGSDAQVIHRRGGKVVKVSTGMMKPHSKEEYIDLEDLNRCADYLWHLAGGFRKV